MEELKEQNNTFEGEQTLMSTLSQYAASLAKDNEITSFAFYDYYSLILDALSDDEAGRISKNMCKYMFTENPEIISSTDKERYYWDNILDELRESKESQLKGRPSASQNRRMKHFTFYRNFYDALKLMDDKQCGQYVKAISNFMFNNVIPQLKPPVEGFFRLAMHKLNLSKVRKRVGTKGGKAEKIPVTVEQVKAAEKIRGLSIGIDGFLERNPQIKNDIYKTSMYLTDDIDWTSLDEALPYSEYSDCTSLYKILTHKEEIIGCLTW